MKIHFLLSISSLLFLLSFCACTGSSTSDIDAQKKAQDTTIKPSKDKGDQPPIDTLLNQYDPPGRVVWQKPQQIIDKLGDLSDKVVADLGAGSGFFSRRLAQQAKKVIALEIDERLIHFMDSIKRIELKPEYQDRLETRLATPTDSRLKPGEADVVLIVNTFIYIKDRSQYLKHLLEVLPDGGRLLIVDFKKKRIPIRYPPQDIRLELYKVENELYDAGFKNITSDDCALDYQYIVIGEK